MTENLDRVLPSGVDAVIRRGTWDVLPIFQFIQARGNVDESEMFRTFNMGIGMILAVSPENAETVLNSLDAGGQKCYEIGRTRPGGGKVVYE